MVRTRAVKWIAAAILSVLVLGWGPGAYSQSAAGESWEDTALPLRQLEPLFYPLPQNVEILHLENGMQVLLMRNPAQPMVGIYTQVKVGAAYEDFRTSGMSHMLEHLLFNGTEKYTQQELYDLADQHGAYNNANTTDFFTNFMMVLPAHSLETGLEIQSQMLFHSLIPADKFEKEQGIILGELVGARDRPGHFTEEILREVIFARSSLAMPTLGTRSTIANMSRDDVNTFYKSFYVPNNMVLTLAGRFARDEALTLLEKYFGAVAPGAVQLPQLRPLDFLEQSRTVVRRGGTDRVLALAFEAPTYGAADFFSFHVMTELLNAPGSGILTSFLEDLDAAVRPVLTVWWEKAEGLGRLVLQFELPAQAEPSLCWRLVQDACTAARETGITDTDVLEIVRMEETEILLQREQLRHTGIYAAEPIVLGGVDFFVGYLAHLRAVEAAEVAAALQTYLIDTPCLAVLIEPAVGLESAGTVTPEIQLPPGMKVPPAMLEAMRKAGMSTAPASGGKSAATDGEAAATGDRPEITVGAGAPDAGLAGDMAGYDILPIERTALSNGAVLVSQQNPASPLLAVHVTVRYRAVLDDGHPGALNLVHRLLTAGIGGCDETCLARKLRQLGAVVKLVDNPDIPMDDYYTNGLFSFVRVEVAAANGPATIQLLTDLTQHASFSSEDFERERQEQIALLERRQGSARDRANQLLNETLYGAHPLARPVEGEVASLQELTYDDLRAIYRRAFAPQNLIFAVVSPYTHAELTALLEQSLPARGEPAEELPPLPPTEAAVRVTASLGGEMTAIRLGAIFELTPADAKAMEILVGILSDRMAMDLRETRGLSYSVGAAVASHTTEGVFTTWINPPHERAAEGEQALAQFVAAFDPTTITSGELDKIRNATVGRWMMRLLSSMSQAYYLAMAELSGDVTLYGQMLTGYDKLTLDDLQRVWQEYLVGLPLVTVVVD